MTVKKKHSIATSIEADYAKRLAGNEKETRDLAFLELKSHIMNRSMKPGGGFIRDEMVRLWKGLFYCMWMSDKPFPQEELAKNIAELLPEMNNVKTSKLYWEAFLITMEREWHGIDRLRLDKFCLLIRFMFQQTLIFLKKNAWNKELMDWFETMLKNGPASPWSPNPSLSRGSPIGIRHYIAEIYLEELIEVGHGALTAEQVLQFLQPYCEVVCESTVATLRGRVIKKIFQELIDQSDAVMKVVPGYARVKNMQRLNCDYAGLALKLIKLRNNGDVSKSNYGSVTKLIVRLKDVAGGNIPVGMVPDFGEEDLNDESEFKEAEDALVQRLYKKMKKDFSNRQRDKKLLRKQAKKWKRENTTLPFQNNDLQDGVDFDRIADMRVDEEGEDTATSFGDKMKQKRKKLAKLKKSGQSEDDKKQGKNKKKVEHKKLNVNQMMNDLVQVRNDDNQSPKSRKRKVGVVSSPNQSEIVIGENKRKGNASNIKSKQISKKCAVTESTIEDVSVQVPGNKRRKMVDSNSVGFENFGIVSKMAKKRSSKRIERIKLNQILRNKLLGDVAKSKAEEKPITININARPRNKTTKLAKPISKKDKIPAFAESPKLKEKKSKTGKSTSKRVSFEMSKIQVQRFRKFDRSCVVSPSPNVTPFDPNRTPDFGLLKQRKQMQKKSKLPPKPKRHRASDFF